jgi:hypothetical protein
MNGKLPTKRSRKRSNNANGKCNGLDPDAELTVSEAVDYVTSHGVPINENILALSRAKNPLCDGPKFLKIRGHWIRYTPRFLDDYIASRLTQVIDPADRRMRRKSS